MTLFAILSVQTPIKILVDKMRSYLIVNQTIRVASAVLCGGEQVKTPCKIYIWTCDAVDGKRCVFAPASDCKRASLHRLLRGLKK
jgi:hypothetical protein